MQNATKKRNTHISGLDALRGLAVLGVLLYHLHMEWAPGGFLGVTIFFVLSGYLITKLLLLEWDQYHKLDMKKFWFRRAKRLLPTFFAMLIIVIAWITIFERSFLINLRENVLASLISMNNWWLIFHDVSYFEKFSPPSPINHLWSLGVEGQFYIFFPIILMIGLRFVSNRKKLALATFLFAIISALLMAIFYTPGIDPSRIYYGTDTRAFSLLIGAFLAIVLSKVRLSKQLSKKNKLLLNSIGFSSLFIIIFMMLRVSEFSSFVYRGGMFLLSIITAICIFTIIHPSSLVGKLLSFKPLCWIGLRSYAMYLWLFPIIILSNTIFKNGETNYILIVVQIILIFLATTLSWKFIEKPVQNGALEKLFTKVTQKQLIFYKISLKKKIALSITLLFFIIGIIGLSNPPSNSYASTDNIHDMITKTKEAEKKENANKQNDNRQSSTSNSEKTNSNNQEMKPTSESKLITAIGDSILVDIAPYLENAFPNIVIDGEIGRQMYGSEKVIHQLKKNGKLGEIVILELGTNGAFSTKQIDSVISAIGKDRSIYVINTRLPNEWQNRVNSLLERTANTYDNVTLIDWYSYSNRHPEFFYNDNTHPNPTGAKAYVSLIKKFISTQ